MIQIQKAIINTEDAIVARRSLPLLFDYEEQAVVFMGTFSPYRSLREKAVILMMATIGGVAREIRTATSISIGCNTENFSYSAE
jgi:hypothetical protein